MSARGHKWQVTQGHTVMAICDDGLFVKNGELVTGHGTAVELGELQLFSRPEDAERSRDQLREHYKDQTRNGHTWDFVVMPVLVKEHV